jgi:hypothetical protein
MRSMRALAVVAVCGVALLGAGCANAPPRDGAAESQEAPEAPDPEAMGRLGRTPLADFNLGDDDIPDVLLRAVADTYALPVPLDCETLGTEIAALNAVLGPDLDVLKAAEREDDFARTAVVGALRSMIPYHGVIGVLTGARKRARRIAEAIAAGVVRRGYLKGHGEAIGCAMPAAPVRVQ